MAANATLAKHPSTNSDVIVTRMLISGFTGQLKGWWDNYLNIEQRQAILTAVKREQTDTPILNSTTRQPISDVVTTFVTAITQHFYQKYANCS